MMKTKHVFWGISAILYTGLVFGQVFDNVGSYSNTNVECNTHGSGFFDYDNDGWDDIFVVHNTSEGDFQNLPHTLLRNLANGTFVNTTQAAGVQGYLPPDYQNPSSQGLAAGDYNNDGFIDLCIGMGNPYYQAAIYRNNQNGTFTDMSFYTIPDQGTVHGRCLTFLDYDNDGRLDLLLLRDAVGNDPSAAIFTLYRNTPGGFLNVTAQTGLAIASDNSDLYGFATADFDNDGDLDIYVPRLYANSLFLRNDGGYFQEVSAAVGLPNTSGYLGAVFLDYNNDGFFDLFLKRQGTGPELLRNNGNGTFTNVSSQSGVIYFNTGTLPNDCGFGGGLATADFDNNGSIDILLINRKGNLIHLFKNMGDGTFTEIAETAQLRDLNDWYWSTPVGDFNHDGYMDIYMARSGSSAGSAALYKNRGGSNKWLQLKLTGLAPLPGRSNTSAIGTRIEAHAGGKIQTRQVQGGDGYKVNTFNVHFGMGQETIADSIVIHWPSRIRQTLLAVPVNQTVGITEQDTTIYMGSLYIAGTVTHLKQGNGIKQVYMSMTGDESRNVMNNYDGSYKFIPINAGNKKLTVKPSKTRGEDIEEGVITAYDAALVLRTIAGLEILSDTQKTASEIDLDGSVNALDAALIARYAVGIQNDGRSKVGTWRFIPDSLAYTSVLKVYNHEDFSGFVLGDVSENWGNPGSPGKVLTAYINTETVITVLQSETVDVPVSIVANSKLLAADLWLVYDPARLDLTDVLQTGLTGGFQLIFNETGPGNVRIALYGAEPLLKSGSILNVRFKRKDTGTSPTSIIWERVAFNDHPVHIAETVLVFSGQDRSSEKPGAFSLKWNYPNPFNPGTTISYELDRPGNITLVIYDLQGRTIRILSQGRQGDGMHSAQWDGKDDRGSEVSTGIYFCRLELGDRSAVLKLLKAK